MTPGAVKRCNATSTGLFLLPQKRLPGSGFPQTALPGHQTSNRAHCHATPSSSMTWTKIDDCEN